MNNRSYVNNNVIIKNFLSRKYKEIEYCIIPINSYNSAYKHCRHCIYVGDTSDNDFLFKYYTSLYLDSKSVIFPPSPPPSNFFITWTQLNNIKMFLTIHDNKNFLNRFKIDLTCDKLIEFEEKKISALLVIELYESKMAKCMRKIKRGIYFNIDTKTVFKFLSRSESITEFIYEALICSQYWLYIGTKKCLAFFPSVMCAEYSYEGPDIESIYVPNSLEIRNASCMYDNTLQLQYVKNIQTYVNYNIIGIFKKILDIIFNLFSLGLTSIDLKPDNLSLNIHGEIKFIDVEFTYPIGTQLKRLKISRGKLRDKMKAHPQTAPEFFSGDYNLTEASTIYGLNSTFNRIIELVEKSLDINKKNGLDVSNKLNEIERIKYNKKFISLMDKSVKIDVNKRPSIHEFYDCFHNV